MRPLLSAALASLASLLLPALASAQAGAEWQLVLLKPKDCISCVYAEQMLKQRGFLQSAELSAPGAPSIDARIVRRNSSELTPEETRELLALPYIDPAVWQQHAGELATQVLLKRDGHVVAAGNIADSADLRRESFPERVMTPHNGDDPLQLRAEHDRAYGQIFLRRWNLDWFYELALDPTRARARSMDAFIASRSGTGPSPAPAAHNVLLMSTASWPGNNEIFNAVRIQEIREALEREAGVRDEQITVFHGGDNPTAPNAVEVRNGRLAFARQALDGARPATFGNLAAFFDGVKRREASRNLLVLVGHGGPDGAGVWASPAALGPEDLAALHRHGGGDDVVVSGNCFGGVLARAMSCGFFAARPDIIATGCQADAAEVAQSRDYLKVFFSSLDPEERTRVDADHDGRVSFEEAHWHASVSGDTRNVTYTTVDALADAWFDAHPDALPPRMTVGELRQLAGKADPAERQAVTRMTDGLTAQVEIRLTELAAQARAWSQLQAGVRPMLAQLARRLLFQQRDAKDEPQLARVRACESQPIAQFLAP